MTRWSDDNKTVNPGQLEHCGIHFNRATFFTAHRYIAVSDAARKQLGRKLMDEMYIYIPPRVLIQYHITASLYSRKLRQPFPQLRKLHANPVLRLYGTATVLLAKFRTDLAFVTDFWQSFISSAGDKKGKPCWVTAARLLQLEVYGIWRCPITEVWQRV